MGKYALIATVVVGFAVLLSQQNSVQISSQANEANTRSQQSISARELAFDARKLVLAGWIDSDGLATAAPFTKYDRDGGNVEVIDYTLAGDVLDFTIQSTVGDNVHEVRSRYQWNDFAATGIQLKAADIQMNISPLSTLNLEDISLDDQSIVDLQTLVVDELSQVSSLGELGLGWSDLQGDVETALRNSGNNRVNILPITNVERDYLDNQPGVFFPDQVVEALTSFRLSHPELISVRASTAALDGDFGPGDDDPDSQYEMLHITGDFDLANDFSGKGILLIEGDFRIQPDVNFDWEGLVVINPPDSILNPVVDLQGYASITGSFVAMQEGVPDVGHMDLSVHRDTTGAWPVANGDNTEHFYMHTHDYSGTIGWNVTFTSTRPGAVVNAYQSKFDEFLSAYPANKEIYLALTGTNNHGRAILDLELSTHTLDSRPVSAGFDPLIAAPGNAYQTVPFEIGQLEHLEIDVTRMSALVKLWDDGVTPHPGCTYNGWGVNATWGTVCVWDTYGRMGALTLQIWEVSTGNKIYEAPLYWHRAAHEVAAFQAEMQDLINEITSTAYGLDFTLGPNVTISSDPQAVGELTAFGNIEIGVIQLGTWQRHYDLSATNKNPTQ